MIDWDGFRYAAKACQANGWFFDGVLSAQVNPREWAYQHAQYFMLDFVVKGGKISLAPSYPVDPGATNGYAIDYARQPKISALFTDGNIIDTVMPGYEGILENINPLQFEQNHNKWRITDVQLQDSAYKLHQTAMTDLDTDKFQ